MQDRRVEATHVTVDVLMPAYNAERTIIEAVGSLQRQTHRDLRIFVVNDGSTDRTGPLLREMAAQDPRIIVIETANQGIVSARNTLIEHSSAPVMAILDSDDISFPDRIARQLSYLEAHPDCVAVGVNAWYIGDDGRRTGGHTTYKGDVKVDPHAFPAVEPYLINAFVMMRRDPVIAVGGYRHVVNAEDTDLYWRLLPHGRLHNLDEILGEVRISAVSGASASAHGHGGRISAVHSQLAAVSHLRRLATQPDLEFPQERGAQMRRVGSVEALLHILSSELTPEEARHVRWAAGMKLLEYASYRPYLLDIDDCRIVSQALQNVWPRLDRPARVKIMYQRAHVLARLLRRGRWREAQTLGSAASLSLVLPSLAARRIKARIQDRRSA